MMDFPLTLAAVFRHAEQVFPRRPVVTRCADGSLHRYTYADFGDRTRRLAGALQRYGIGPGERVATLGWNHYQHLEAYFGIPITGAVVAHTQPPPAPRRARLHHQRRGRPRRCSSTSRCCRSGNRSRRGPVSNARSSSARRARSRRRISTTKRCSPMPSRSPTSRISTSARRRRCATRPAPPAAQGRAVLAPRARAPHVRRRAAQRHGRQRARRRAAGRADVSRQRLGPAVSRPSMIGAKLVLPGPAPRSGQPGRSVRPRARDDDRGRADDLAGHPAVSRREPRQFTICRPCGRCSSAAPPYPSR